MNIDLSRLSRMNHQEGYSPVSLTRYRSRVNEKFCRMWWSRPEFIGSIVLLAMAVSSEYAMAYTVEPKKHSLRSWFVRTPPEEPRDPKKIRELKQVLMDLALALVFGVVPFPAIWKWLGWLFCFCAFLYIVQSTIDDLHEYPAKTRLLGGVTLVIAFVAVCWSTAKGMWIEEKSNVLTGELCSFRADGICYTPFIPIIEVGGDSGSNFIYIGDEKDANFGTFARDVGLRIERGDHGMQISTPVLDRSGKKIADIERNHWTVIPQPGIWDKNYTDNALEIKDSRGEVVLQLKYLPDRLQIAVEWRDQFGRGQEWAKCLNSNNQTTGCIIPWGSPQTELQNEVPIDPIFLYPSKEHWGEFAKN